MRSLLSLDEISPFANERAMNDEFQIEDEADLSIFPPPLRTDPCQLYLISPQDVGGNFPDRLMAALAGGPVAAFQLRVKDVDSHELADWPSRCSRSAPTPTSPSSSTTASAWPSA